MSTLKKRLLILAVGLMLTVVLVWLNNQGRLVIELNTADKNTISYKLTNQNGQKTNEVKTGSTKITRLVSKGSYEILISQNGNSSFSVVNTRGFLRKTTIKLGLSPEKSRQFIGNNPQPCTFFNGTVLYSYACGAELSRVVKHEPATYSLPTYTSNLPDTLNAIILGTASTNAGSVVLLKEQSISTSFSVATLGSGFSLTNKKELPELDRLASYSIQPYSDGFIIYDSSFSKMLYYSSISSSPRPISISKPDDNSQKPAFLTTAGDNILAVFSTSPQGQDTAIEASTNKIKNTLVVYSQGQSRKYIFDKQQYSDASTCGQDKLCLISGKQLSVYDGINSSSPKFLYKVNGVNSIFSTKTSLVLARDNETLQLDIDRQTGSREYSFGDYRLCGIQNDVGAYILCLINNKNNKVALRIDEATNDSNDIDKKIAELQKTSEVKNISIYKNYIYISPNLGPLKYDSVIKGYVYDPETKKRVNAAIDQKVLELKIDTNVYHIINIFR